MERRWVTSRSYLAALKVLVDARRSAGLSQRELSERLGKPRSFVSKIEDRGRRIDVVEMIAWARALELEPADLMSAVSQAVPDPIEF